MRWHLAVGLAVCWALAQASGDRVGCKQISKFIASPSTIISCHHRIIDAPCHATYLHPFDSIHSAPPIPPVYLATTSRYMVAAWDDPNNKASIYAASPFRYRRSSIRRRSSMSPSSSPSQHTTLLLPTNATAATRCCPDWERRA